jgi:hypothetical protein
LIQARYGYQLGAQQVAAGVQTTQIAADTAVKTERMQQATNRLQIRQALPIAQVQAGALIAGAKIQASTQSDIAHTQAASSFFNTALGILPKLLTGGVAG